MRPENPVVAEDSQPPERKKTASPAPDMPDASPGSLRLILWLALLYALGLALMVVEDILSHIFI